MIAISRLRLTTPGNFPARSVFVLGILAMSILFIFDVATGSDIRLHVLYVFPLAAIALHCERIDFSVAGLILSLLCQIYNSLVQGMSTVALRTDAVIFLLSSGLVVFLGRAVRENYLEKARQASTDWLTGLHNRGSFETIVEMELSRHRRYGGVFSLALIDLDDFKSLNDSRGHHAGDQALKLLAEVLRENSRGSDAVARLGGDEFAILMPNTGHEDCQARCQQLSLLVMNRMAEAGFGTTASVGGSTYENSQKSTDAILQDADKAMYAAKAKGKGGSVSLVGS